MNFFFELIQVSLGRRISLSDVPSASEWETVYSAARRHAIVGVLLRGLEQLPKNQLPETLLLLRWIGEMQTIQKRNREIDKRCMMVFSWLREEGFRGSLLKGQGIARLYEGMIKEGDEMASLRQSGDIDIFVDGGMENALLRMREIGVEMEGWDYKHARFTLWGDTELELHYHVDVLYDWIKNRKLQKWFEEHKVDLFEEKDGWTTPSVQFNVFYILLHIYRHFFDSGVGLRQVMDYYMVLRAAYKSRLLVTEYVEAVKVFGMGRFASGLMWVLLEVMNMPREWMPWRPDEREGRFIISRIMKEGNFGYRSTICPLKCGRVGQMMALLRHNTHLVMRYPHEAVAAPLWMVGHWCWKQWVMRRGAFKTYLH